MTQKDKEKEKWEAPKVVKLKFKNTFSGGQGPVNPEDAGTYPTGHS